MNDFVTDMSASASTDQHTTNVSEKNERRLDQLYSGHIPTSLFQKTLLGVGSALVAIRKPWRDGTLDLQAVMMFLWSNVYMYKSGFN